MVLQSKDFACLFMGRNTKQERRRGSLWADTFYFKMRPLEKSCELVESVLATRHSGVPSPVHGSKFVLVAAKTLTTCSRGLRGLIQGPRSLKAPSYSGCIRCFSSEEVNRMGGSFARFQLIRLFQKLHVQSARLPSSIR